MGEQVKRELYEKIIVLTVAYIETVESESDRDEFILDEMVEEYGKFGQEKAN